MNNDSILYYIQKIQDNFLLPRSLNTSPSLLQFHELKSFKWSVKQTLSEFTQSQILALKSEYSFESAKHSVQVFLEDRTQLIDALIQLWFNRSEDEDYSALNLTVMAIGGYGRSQLSIHSDIDLLILHDEEEISDAQSDEIRLLTQFLWDIGLIPSIQTATLTAFKNILIHDLSLATSILSARTLVGNDKLCQILKQEMEQDTLWSQQAFIAGKLEDQQIRHTHYQGTGYHLEPDIKQNMGGLRDLHLIYWFVRKCYASSETIEDLVKQKQLTMKEYHLLIESEKTLLLFRFALHAITPRQEDRLLFSHQLTLVETFPFFQSTEGIAKPSVRSRTSSVSHVEVMMKQLYQTMATIHLQTQVINEMFSEPLKNQRKIINETNIEDVFVLRTYQIFPSLSTDAAISIDHIELQTLGLVVNAHFTADNLLRFFYHLADLSIPYDAIDLHALRELNQIHLQFTEPLIELEVARKDFIDILLHPNATQFALLPLHKLGILWHYMPTWTHIIGLMQFDRFHAYTVDEHTFQVLLQIEKMKSGETFALAKEVMMTYPDYAVLRLSALFHDVAKGLGGDHAQKGKEIFEQFAEKHGLDKEITQLVSWLIENHLLLSITAQRRDISDPLVIEKFAIEVKTQIQLDCLFLLTIADIKGTNQTLWSNWKQSLLEQLYLVTKHFLNRPYRFQSNWRQLIKHNKSVATDLLIHHLNDLKEKASSPKMSLAVEAEFSKLGGCLGSMPPNPILNRSDCDANRTKIVMLLEQFWKRCRIDYLMYHKPSQLAWHAQMLLCQNLGKISDILIDNEGNNVKLNLPEVAIHATNQFNHGGTELFIWCQDRPNLFVGIVNLMDRRNVSILHAQIFTNRDAMAMDSFVVVERTGKPLSIARQGLLKKELSELVLGIKIKGTKMPSKRINESYFQHKTEIKYLTSGNPNRTYIEINTLDRPGLLFTIASIFTAFSLNLLGARITTIGERVEDMFILTTSQRSALDEDLKVRLSQRLFTEIEAL